MRIGLQAVVLVPTLLLTLLQHYDLGRDAHRLTGSSASTNTITNTTTNTTTQDEMRIGLQETCAFTHQLIVGAYVKLGRGEYQYSVSIVSNSVNIVSNSVSIVSSSVSSSISSNAYDVHT